MADVISKKKRSQVMALIKSKGNKNTELKLISIFRAYKLSGWRRNQNLPGKPDFAFPMERLALFVDGCFWHGCKQHCRKPSSNVAYWLAKIHRNRKRDRIVGKRLRKNGWNVLRIWEHELLSPKSVVHRIKSTLKMQKEDLLETES